MTEQVQTSIKLTKEQHKAIDLMAFDLKVTRQTLIRQLIVSYLEAVNP